MNEYLIIVVDYEIKRGLLHSTYSLMGGFHQEDVAVLTYGSFIQVSNDSFQVSSETVFLTKLERTVYDS